jgi:pyridinium-3,5-bisthiocarboxylic acid mononucleotide nickel chelatase
MKPTDQMKTLYIEPDCGVAGDMLVAALMKLEGAMKIDLLREALKSMPVTEEWSIDLKIVSRHSISSGLFVVEVEEKHEHQSKDGQAGAHALQKEEHHHHHGRTLPEITDIIMGGEKLSGKVKERACAVFAKLADAESRVHGKDIESVHFHEVGAVDAIIDIVGCCLLVESLGVDKIISSAVGLGKGTVKSAHGVLPVPVPATLNLLEGIPVNHTGISSELATPTGSALLAVLVDEWLASPEGRLSYSSYGAGTRDLKERAAVIRVSLYESTSIPTALTDKVGVLECNMDDMPGEAFSWISPKLLELGALDFVILPVQMKKNRPGILLQVLCLPEDIAKFADFLLKETTTLGVRYRIDNRIKLNRKIIKIATPWGDAVIKEAVDAQGCKLKSKLEYENCAKLASVNHLSYLEMHAKLAAFVSDK